MLQIMRRLLHELGTGRALVNASHEQAQEEMLVLRIDALGRRLAPAAAATAAPADHGVNAA